MSLSISAVPNTTPIYPATEPPPVPTPTLSQQAHTLASSGHSVDQIAVALGIPTAQVNSSLGIQTGSTTTTAAVVAAAAGLSVHV